MFFKTFIFFFKFLSFTSQLLTMKQFLRKATSKGNAS